MRFLFKINKFLPYLKNKSNLQCFKNILVVSNTGLGDTLLSTPAIRSLRESFPDINITFLISKKMSPLFQEYEYVNDFEFYQSGFFNQIRTIIKLRKKQIDTVFLFHSNGPEDIFFSVLSGAKNILKMTNNKDHKYLKLFINSPNKLLQHEIEKKLDLVRYFGPKKIFTEMQLPEHYYNLESYFPSNNSNMRYLGIQMGAQDIYKMWPVENFISLAEKISKNFLNIKFVLLGYSKFEQQQAKKFQIKLNKPDLIVNLCGKSPIKSLPNIINNLDLLISNDTGTFHLAVALKIRTVSLFGPTDARVYGPYQDMSLHRVIQKDGGFVNQLPKKQRNQDGMRLIKVDDVYSEVKDLL